MVIVYEEEEEEEEKIKMYDMVRGMPGGPITMKKKAMTMAELDKKMSKAWMTKSPNGFPKTNKSTHWKWRASSWS